MECVESAIPAIFLSYAPVFNVWKDRQLFNKDVRLSFKTTSGPRSINVEQTTHYDSKTYIIFTMGLNLHIFKSSIAFLSSS